MGLFTKKAQRENVRKQQTRKAKIVARQKRLAKHKVLIPDAILKALQEQMLPNDKRVWNERLKELLQS